MLLEILKAKELSQRFTKNNFKKKKKKKKKSKRV